MLLLVWIAGLCMLAVFAQLIRVQLESIRISLHDRRVHSVQTKQHTIIGKPVIAKVDFTAVFAVDLIVL